MYMYYRRASSASQGCLSTPLHVAAEAGYADICRRLLAESADPEARDVVRPRRETCVTAQCARYMYAKLGVQQILRSF